MRRDHLRLGVLGAVGNLLIAGSCHYFFLVFLAAGNLTQDTSFLSVVFIVLIVPHLAVGFVNGYFASTKNAGIILTLSASFLGQMVGAVASGLVFDLMQRSETTLWNRDGRPIVQNIGWYSLVLGIVGIAVGVIAISIFTRLRDLKKNQTAQEQTQR